MKCPWAKHHTPTSSGGAAVAVSLTADLPIKKQWKKKSFPLEKKLSIKITFIDWTFGQKHSTSFKTHVSCSILVKAEWVMCRLIQRTKISPLNQHWEVCGGVCIDRHPACCLCVFYFYFAVFRMFLGINLWAGCEGKTIKKVLTRCQILSKHPRGGYGNGGVWEEGPTLNVVFTNSNPDPTHSACNLP